MSRGKHADETRARAARRRTLTASAAVAAFACVPLLVTGLSCKSTAPVGEADGCMLGLHIETVNGSDDALESAITAIEVGTRPMDLRRVFRQWDNATPGNYERAIIASGRVLVESWNLAGSGLEWVDIAKGNQEADAHISEVADGYAALGADVISIFEFQVDNILAKDKTLKASDYVAAMRHVVGIFRARGATNVRWGWTMTRKSFLTSYDETYPGDDVIDWIGVGAYNYGSDTGGSAGANATGSWVSLRDLLADFLTWAQPHGKPLLIDAWMSVESAGDGGARKAEWMDEALDTFRTSPQIRAACYSSTLSATTSTTSSRVDSSPSASAAFRRLALDPYMRAYATATRPGVAGAGGFGASEDGAAPGGGSGTAGGAGR